VNPEPPKGEIYDIAVIGGGINGAGIARDAAGRGWSVIVCERGDLAGATSSASTKLIHGGLRYLEYYEFRLVREALAEREILLGMAPHIIWPLRFVIPHGPEQRPAWMVRLGLFLYDHIGGRRQLPASQSVNFSNDPAGGAVKSEFRRGFSYSDCWVDDARLVVLNAVDAAANGATILTRTPCFGARRADGRWRLSIGDRHGGRREIEARAVVNAAGPWVRQVATEVLGLKPLNGVRLVQGSHIVVPKLFDGQQAYLLQNTDGRVVFTIPYERDFTLIGTTDTPLSGGPETAAATADEAAYLCAVANRYLRRPVSPVEVVWRYCGVRPLYDDGSNDPKAVTRDYVFEMDRPEGEAPALSIYGGKITTYRRLAEQALDRLKPFLPASTRGAARGPWTAGKSLPGGDIKNFEIFVGELTRRFPRLDAALLRRLARRHGRRAETLLAGVKTEADLGENFGADLWAREVEWLMSEEWAETPEDVLWRRTKTGLRLTARQQETLGSWMSKAKVHGR
jgi:glycerol-3-phosphate dehydrogenase